MTDQQLSSMVRFLVQLRAENRAMRRALQSNTGIGSAGMNALIQEENLKLQELPAIAAALHRFDLSQLPALLDTLSTALPQ